MNYFIKESYRVKAERIVKKLQQRNMNAYYVDSKNEAVNNILSIISEGEAVSWGGSVTLDEIDIKNILKDKGVKVIDRDCAENAEDRIKIMREALLSDVFLTSANAITSDGEILNIDGMGNRLAAINFGPKKVIFVVGMNKVSRDLESAMKRIKQDAVIPNVLRLGIESPCSKSGVCSQCICDETVCGQILVTRYNRVKDRVSVILVGESLGF